MKSFNLIVYVYRGINTLEAKFIKKNYPDYKSDLSKHVLIVTAISIAASFLSSFLQSLMFQQRMTNLPPESPMSGSAPFVLISAIPLLCCAVYWAFYLRRHLHLLPTTGQKIGYGLFTCLILAILGPVIFPVLAALVLLTIAISVALFLLNVILVIISLFDGGGSKRKRFSLDNGDKVTEKSGMFGEKYYDGDSGKSYTTNDGGGTFREK